MPDSYLPSSDLDLVAWMNNFQSKIVSYKTTLGLSDADVNGVLADYAMFAYTVEQVEIFKTRTRERVAFKDTLRKGPAGQKPSMPSPLPPMPDPPAPVAPNILGRLRALVKRVKNHPNYTNAIGADLGIETFRSVDHAVPKPVVVASAIPNSQIRIAFKKKRFSGAIIERQRGDETVWTRIDKSLSSPYVDTESPLAVGSPELRRYRLRYLIGNAPTGDYSDTITVTTTP